MQTQSQAIADELAGERRKLAEQERAEHDLRLCDRDEWLASTARRRDRIETLEAEHEAARALEESEAELRESWDEKEAA